MLCNNIDTTLRMAHGVLGEISQQKIRIRILFLPQNKIFIITQKMLNTSHLNKTLSSSVVKNK